MTRVIAIGQNGYAVLVREHEAAVVRSVVNGVHTKAAFSFAELGKAEAVGAACLTALDLDSTQEALNLAERME